MTDIRHIGGKLTDNDMHPDSLYWDTDDEDPNEIFCSLCGLGCDTWLEVKKHIFCEIHFWSIGFVFWLVYFSN